MTKKTAFTKARCAAMRCRHADAPAGAAIKVDLELLDRSVRKRGV